LLIVREIRDALLVLTQPRVLNHLMLSFTVNTSPDQYPRSPLSEPHGYKRPFLYSLLFVGEIGEADLAQTDRQEVLDRS